MQTSILSVGETGGMFGWSLVPGFMIDGLAADRWLSHHLNNDEPCLGLVPAHYALRNADLALAWERTRMLEPGGCSLLPLLVCPDDADLNCVVVVVEQLPEVDYIVWNRFGLLVDPITEPEPQVDWFADIPAIRFAREAFMQALDVMHEAESKGF